MKTLFHCTRIFTIATCVAVASCCEQSDMKLWIPRTTTITNNYDYENLNENDLIERDRYASQTSMWCNIIVCKYLTSVEQIHFYSESSYEQHLKIIDSNISSVPPSGLLKFNRITKLYLSNLHIKTVLPGAFNGLTQLKELYLDHNELTKLSKGVYNSLNQLEILNLASNKIRRIENLALSGAGSLLELNLVKNNLSIIQEGVLEARLTVLNLSENPLEEIHLNELSTLEQLLLSDTSLTKFDINLSALNMKILNMSSSQLSTIDFSLFPNLHTLDLSSNSISFLINCNRLNAIYVKLDHNQIYNLTAPFKGIKKLNMAHNHLDVLKKLYFQNSLSVVELDFSYNSIDFIESDAFRNLLALKRLYLQHNKITRVEPGLFRDLHTLKVLNLSHNSVEKLIYGTFDSLIQLTVLDLSHNRIVNIHQGAFHYLSSLQTLLINSNQISSFDIHYLPPSIGLSLDNNSWTCKELFTIVLHFKSLTPGKYHNGPNLHGIACKETTEDVQITMKNSAMQRFFNRDFTNSSFFRFFNKDYRQSNFFKYLNKYKGPLTKQEHLYNTSTEKITSFEVTSDSFNNRVLVFMVLVQVLIAFLLLCGVALIFGILMNLKQIYVKQVSSQIELY